MPNSQENSNMKKKAWVVTVDMGYGHQRASYPLKDIAYDRIVTANSDKLVTKEEKKKWKKFQGLYETVSRFKSIPLIGEAVWKIYDRFQAISPYYPFKDESHPSFGTIQLHKLIKKGFLSGVVEYAKEKNIPFVTTFFATAIAAHFHGLKDIYCIVTDTDINRAWVPKDPKKSNIYYLTPTEHSTKRIHSYGIKKENIFYTGFPLPKENLGRNLKKAKHDLADRLVLLDPNKIFINRYKEVIKKKLSKPYLSKPKRKLTLMYAIGGAGAQKEFVIPILKSLKNKINENKMNLTLVAGTRLEVAEYFKKEVEKQGLGKHIGKSIIILSALSKKGYFALFNKLLRKTDILWTKPSELSFYTALGIPIIVSPPVGHHEILNKKWLLLKGSGIEQEDPKYTEEWLFELIRKGILAEAAWEGFIESPKYGTYNIEKIIFEKDKSKVKFRY
jgi:hypothetical protein